MSGQPYPGAPTPTYPSVPGQQSVPAPPYVGAPGSGIAPSGSGVAGGAIVPSGASPAPTGADPCYGDEVITYSPESPRIGNEFLVAVTSSRPHPYGRLAGTEPTRFMRERPGQRGYVWEWTVQPSYPGLHEYTFYVDSTVVCQKVQLRVLQSLSTRTPTPTKVPTPYGFDNGNSNNNSNNNNIATTTSTAITTSTMDRSSASPPPPPCSTPTHISARVTGTGASTSRLRRMRRPCCAPTRATRIGSTPTPAMASRAVSGGGSRRRGRRGHAAAVGRDARPPTVGSRHEASPFEPRQPMSRSVCW